MRERYLNVVKRFGLKGKMVLAIGLLIIMSILTVAIMSLYVSKNAVEKEIFRSYENQVKGISDSIEILMENQIKDLHNINGGNFKSLISMTVPEIKESKDKNLDVINVPLGLINSEKEKSASKGEIFIVNNDGIIILSTLKDIDFIDVKDRDYFKKISSGAEFSLSDVITSRITGGSAIMIAAPIKDAEGKKIGVIAKELSTEIFHDLFEQYTKGSFYPYILDSSGNVLYHPKEEMIGKPVGVKEIDNIGRENKIEEINKVEYSFNGEKKAGLYNGINEYHWKVFSAGNLSEMNQGINDLFKLMIISSIVILIVGLGFVYLIAVKLSKPIVLLEEGAKQVSNGDLTVLINKVKTNDEIEKLSDSFINMVDNLKNILTKINEASLKVNYDSKNLNEISKEVSASNSEITKAMEEIATGVVGQSESALVCNQLTEDLSRIIQNLEIRSKDMSNQGEEVRVSLKDSTRKLNNLIDTNGTLENGFLELIDIVQGLIDEVVSISNIIETIESISKQTNLLALNASIESAKAGDAGKGFAVVASEIRNLSNSTNDATTNIKLIIEKMNNIVVKTKKSLDRTKVLNDDQIKDFDVMRVTFGEMFNSLETMIGYTNNITKGIGVVGEKKDIVLDSINQMAAVSQEVAALTEEVNSIIEEQEKNFNHVSDSAEGLMVLSENLSEEISSFKIK